MIIAVRDEPRPGATRSAAPGAGAGAPGLAGVALWGPCNDGGMPIEGGAPGIEAWDRDIEGGAPGMEAYERDIEGGGAPGMEACDRGIRGIDGGGAPGFPDDIDGVAPSINVPFGAVARLSSVPALWGSPLIARTAPKLSSMPASPAAVVASIPVSARATAPAGAAPATSSSVRSTRVGAVTAAPAAAAAGTPAPGRSPAASRAAAYGGSSPRRAARTSPCIVLASG
jgi:hypothetical protein